MPGSLRCVCLRRCGIGLQVPFRSCSHNSARGSRCRRDRTGLRLPRGFFSIKPGYQRVRRVPLQTVVEVREAQIVDQSIGRGFPWCLPSALQANCPKHERVSKRRDQSWVILRLPCRLIRSLQRQQLATGQLPADDAPTRRLWPCGVLGKLHRERVVWIGTCEHGFSVAAGRGRSIDGQRELVVTSRRRSVELVQQVVAALARAIEARRFDDLRLRE